jgi:hypothetical protein
VAGLGLTLFGDWAKGVAILSDIETRFQKATEKAVLQEAHYLRGKMVQNITTGGQTAGQPFAPPSPTTLIIRRFLGFGGTKPLLVSGAMRSAITVIKTTGGVFVGIKRAAKGTKGGVNLAELHEFGGGPWTRPMTPKQRRFLAAAFAAAGQKFGQGGGGVLKIRIPARPFIGPVVDMFAKGPDVAKRFWASVAASMNWDLGRP